MKNPSEDPGWKNFVHNIIWLREKHNMTKAEMASILGVSVKMLERIEGGELPRSITVKVFFRLEQHFHIPPAEQLKWRLDERE